MISVEQLTYRYPGTTVDAVHNLSLTIGAGRLFGLLGPNGSGKTTLISLLMGLLQPAAGRIRFADALSDADGPGTPSARLALVPQDYAFYQRLTVLENLRFFVAVLGMDARRRHERVARVMETTGLEAFGRIRAQRLSGGLKRRLNLAIGLLSEPGLLLLDEPTVGIDPQSRHFILESIRRLNADGITVVYTSHYMEEVQNLCDEIAILDRGHLLAQGDLQTLLGDAGDGQLTIALDQPPGTALQADLARYGAFSVDRQEIRIARCSSHDLRPMLDRLAQDNLTVTRMRYGYSDLEDLFLHLTGHQLRD